MIEHGRKTRQVIEKNGGASRDRTDGLVVANDGIVHDHLTDSIQFDSSFQQ